MLRYNFISTLCLLSSLTAASAETSLERGEYLVNSVMACDGCHTPRGAGGLNMQRRFSGGSQIWDEATYTVRGSNISQDRETGIGTWSDADIRRALVEGVRPNGVPLSPQMPFAFYKLLTPSDLDAVIAYVRSVPAIRNEVPSPQYKAEMPATPAPNGGKAIGTSVPSDPVQRGSISVAWPTAWSAIRVDPLIRIGTSRAWVDTR
jgi:mono/diheme cytochrome c family protein